MCPVRTERLWSRRDTSLLTFLLSLWLFGLGSLWRHTHGHYLWLNSLQTNNYRSSTVTIASEKDVCSCLQFQGLKQEAARTLVYHLQSPIMSNRTLILKQRSGQNWKLNPKWSKLAYNLLSHKPRGSPRPLTSINPPFSLHSVSEQ